MITRSNAPSLASAAIASAAGPEEPLDTTPITPFETVGGLPSEP
jgi:hypothetical protein